MIDYTLIINPIAGNGRTLKKRPEIERFLEQRGVSYEVRITEGPGHAVELARKPQGRTVVAVGGDGTVHEVAYGIIAAGCTTPLGVIPLGTGNDFVKMLGISRRLDEALHQLIHGRLQFVDYGEVTVQEQPGEDIRQYFVNAVGMGFDASVAVTMRGQKKLPGVLSYLLAVFRTLRSWQAPFARVTMETITRAERRVFEDPLFLVTAGNGVSSGGGFYLTPEASVRDGLLDVCLVRDVPRLEVLRVVPRALRGTHVTHPAVHMFRTRRLRVVLEHPMPVHADGELVAERATRMDVQVIPGMLPVISAMPVR